MSANVINNIAFSKRFFENITDFEDKYAMPYQLICAFSMHSEWRFGIQGSPEPPEICKAAILRNGETPLQLTWETTYRALATC